MIISRCISRGYKISIIRRLFAFLDLLIILLTYFSLASFRYIYFFRMRRVVIYDIRKLHFNLAQLPVITTFLSEISNKEENQISFFKFTILVLFFINFIFRLVYFSIRLVLGWRNLWINRLIITTKWLELLTTGFFLFNFLYRYISGLFLF